MGSDKAHIQRLDYSKISPQGVAHLGRLESYLRTSNLESSLLI